MLDEVVALLRCPICGADLQHCDRALRCPNGHVFDLARQGYASLLPGGARPGTADSADMVRARTEFLATGHFDPLSEALAAAAGPGPVLDLGAGTGHHTARVLDRVAGVGLAVDISKHAARRAAAAHPRLGAVVADAWAALPVRDGVAGTVLSVFAPRHAAETVRVLRPGGRLVVATPTAAHLRELVEARGLVSVDPRKDERLAVRLAAFALVEEVLVERRLELSPADVRAVVAMGPSARHAVGAGPADPVVTTLSVRVATYVVDPA